MKNLVPTALWRLSWLKSHLPHWVLIQAFSGREGPEWGRSSLEEGLGGSVVWPRGKAGSGVRGEGRRKQEGVCRADAPDARGPRPLLTSPDTNPGKWEPLSPPASLCSYEVGGGEICQSINQSP